MYAAQFLSYLQHQKKYSEHTVVSYKTDLTDFYSFLEKSGFSLEPSLIDNHVIRAYLVNLMENKFSPVTINRKLSTLKSYFKYLQKGGKILRNPAANVQNLKTPKRLPSILDETPLSKAISAPDTSVWSEKRNNLLLEFLYASGMRVSEVINLKYSQINFSNQSVRVIGKRNKERIIPLMSSILKKIEEFRQQSLEFLKIEPETLFCRQNGLPLYPELVYSIIKKQLSVVTTKQKRSPHVLRHSFASHLLNNGADLNAIKELLGHSSLAATQVYTHSNFEQLKQIYKLAHPKG